MFTSASLPVVLALALRASASPVFIRDDNTTVSSTSFSLPQTDSAAAERAAAITLKQATFLYGASPVSTSMNLYPAGSLGNSTWEADLAELDVELAYGLTLIEPDLALATTAVEATGLSTLADYETLYNGQWLESLPDGVAAGVMTNYTQDLLFSMERLSVNPFSIRRLNPASDTLAFPVDDDIAVNVTNLTLDELLAGGYLFYVDYRDQANLTRITDRYSANCDAYFYIDPCSGDFLPLAIRTDTASMIYTPLDTAEDWLLAKMMYNGNDVWWASWFHFSGTHAVIEIAYAAAVRTLSDSHPVLALLTEMTPQLYSYAQVLMSTLANDGGVVDQTLALSGADAIVYAGEIYQNGGGDFQAGYMTENFQARNIINCTFGPELKSIPYLDDASTIHNAIEAFATTFVDSYYTSADDFTSDTELQAWAAEANGAAGAKDFPTFIDRETLINIITHIGYLSSVVHHTLNSKELGDISASLPFHPMSLALPVPIAKGVTDVVPYLPGVALSLGQVVFAAVFSRPQFFNSTEDLTHFFSNATMLAGMNADVGTAAALFKSTMDEFSDSVMARSFDAEGLSQGMPFIWNTLDPRKAPFQLMA